MYDSYASDYSEEYMDQFVDPHDDIVIDDAHRNFEQIQDDLDTFDCQRSNDVHALFLAHPMKYHLINEA